MRSPKGIVELLGREKKCKTWREIRGKKRRLGSKEKHTEEKDRRKTRKSKVHP